MLQNINILAGLPPEVSGNLKQDVMAQATHIARLQRALELCLDQFDNEIERLKERTEALQ